MRMHIPQRFAGILSGMSEAVRGDEEVPDAMRAWGAFLRAHADLVAEMDAALRAQAGIPLQWYDVLAQNPPRCVSSNSGCS